MMRNRPNKLGYLKASPHNVVRQCFAHATGRDALSSDRGYLDWCEAYAHKWLKLAEEFGYQKWTGEIRTLTGVLTYHEWLKKEVGL